MAGTIVIGFDDSDGAGRALDHAIAEATASGDSLVVVAEEDWKYVCHIIIHDVPLSLYLLHDVDVAARVRTSLRREPDEQLVETIYEDFARRLPAMLPLHADPIPGAVETLAWLRRSGIHVGSTTGYTRDMMDVLEPLARAAGIAPDVVICADEVPQARPAPWACFRIAERLGVYPLSRAVKVGDTPADMAEGRNAGMRCVGLSECGNEVGLGREAVEALDQAERTRLVAEAERRLRAAGAHAVLRSVADLPAWIESQAARGP